MKETDISPDTLTEILESVHVLKEIHQKRALRLEASHEEGIDPALEEEPLHETEPTIPEETELAFEVPDLTLTAGRGKAKLGKACHSSGSAVLEKNKKFCSKYYKTSELESLARHRSFQMTLIAYLDICITTGMVNRAYATTLNYRHKRKRREFDVTIYNQLIHAFAAKGSFSRVRDIMRVLREDRITPTAQTYAGVLECLGRLEQTDEVLKQAQAFLQEATGHGLTMNDILDRSKFTHDQRDVVLALLRSLEPSFEPAYRPPILTYNNHLVDALNEHVLPIGAAKPAASDASSEPVPGAEIMNSKAGFTREQLQEMMQQQVELELKGHLTVKSIEKFPEPTEQVLQYVSTTGQRVCLSFRQQQ